MSGEVTVRGLLEDPYFKDFIVISGKNGLDKAVSSITVLDSPDPFKWSKGGEIVLTSGYIFKIHHNDFLKLVRELFETGMTALFIKLERYIHMIPEEVLEYSNRVGLPIIDVPIGYAFKDIINPTMSQIISSQSEALNRSQKIMEAFTDLVVNNEDLVCILDEISRSLNTRVVYQDLIFDKIYGSSKDDFKNNFTLSNITTKKDNYQNFKVSLGNKVFGYIILDKKSNEEVIGEIQNVIKHATTALLLDSQKRISNSQIEERHKNEFVQDILLHNIKSREEVSKRSNFYNLNLTGLHKVVIVDIDNFKQEYLKLKENDREEIISSKRDEIYKISIREVRHNFPNAIYASFSDSLVFIVNSQDKKTSEFNENIKSCTKRLKNVIGNNFTYSISIGVSDEKNDVMVIDTAFKEAQMAIKVGRVLYKGNSITNYDELGVFKILYSIYDNLDVKEFMETSIGKLIKYDKSTSSNLTNTLISIIDNDWNLKDASKELFIHYNTIKYRYKKIEEILERDLNKAENRLSISLALKIYQMNN